MTRHTPPEAAVRLLRWAIAGPEAAEGVVGDLHEQFLEVCERRGQRAASRWFWIQVIRIGCVFRIRGRSIRQGAPRRMSVVTRLLEEVGQAARSLRRTPSFTILALVILALGIGSATAVFESVRSVAITDLPVHQPDRVVTLTLRDERGRDVALVPSQIFDLARQSGTLQSVAGVLPRTGSMPTTEGGRPLVLDFSFVTSGFLDVLGARPSLGRLFRPSDGQEGAPPVAVISYGTWQRDFSGSHDAVGRHLEATQYQGSYEIIGVAPPGLDFPVGVDYWILPGSRRQALEVVGRMEPGIEQEVARTEFLTLAQGLDVDLARRRASTDATVKGLTDAVLGDARPLLVAVAMAAGLLLLIASANVAGLLLMRAARRMQDITVRRALGASAARIARGHLIEAVLLGVGGGGSGLLLSLLLVRVLRVAVPGQVPRSDLIGLAGAPLGMTLGVTTFAIAVVAVVPTLAVARSRMLPGLHRPERWTSSGRRVPAARRSLVATQVALAVVLLLGAGLLERTLRHLGGLDLGFETAGVSVLELGIDRRDLRGPSELADLLEGVMGQLRAIPSVDAVSPLMARPFTADAGVYETTPLVEGQTEEQARSNPSVPLESGGVEMFATLGIPILRGRGFRDQDREGATRVAVVSQALSNRLWPNESPIGKRIRLSLGREQWWTVVGVAGDTRFRRLRQATPTIYLPWRQFQILPMAWTLAVRADQGASELTPVIRNVVQETDARVYLWTVSSLGDRLREGPMAAPRKTANMLTTFGLAALLLAAIGLYGVMSLAVQEETRDIGIRRALGASEYALSRRVLLDALRTTVLGGVVGLGAGLAASRFLAPLLFEVRPTDPITVLGVSAVMLCVTVAAAYLPIRRATRVDPLVALQAE